MGWKEWPHWLRRGLNYAAIVLVIYLVILTLFGGIRTIFERNTHQLSGVVPYNIFYVVYGVLSVFISSVLIYFTKRSNLKSWFKGGIIGLLVFFSLFFLTLGQGYFQLGLLPSLILYEYYGSFGLFEGWISLISVSLFFYFLIGVLIGWIIGKRKSKK